MVGTDEATEPARLSDGTYVAGERKCTVVGPVKSKLAQ